MQKSIVKFIALSQRHCSTCFGHYNAHHQEPVKLPLQPLVSVWMWRWKCSQPWSVCYTNRSPSNCCCSLWFPYECGGGSVVSRGRLPTTAENTFISTFIRKPDAATAVWRAPDDGQCNARNMSSSICTTKQ
jgi:hypothetical protein